MIDLEQAAARMICVGFAGRDFSPELQELLRRGVSSVILFTRNFESPPQIADLCWQIKNFVDRPVLICIDQEGGRVQRFGPPFTTVPSMGEIGRKNDPAFARRIGRVMARELRSVNIDMNLAPVLDVNSNPANPVIGERSFSNNPQVVAQLGCALIDGLQSSGMAACGKHFPGHGDTCVDSHLDLPLLPHKMDRLNRIELPPFEAAVNSGVAAIMCAHVMFEAIDPEVPATMSQAVIDGLLRKRFGFDRVVCSDDMEMKAIADHFGIKDAVSRGAAAGIDLFFVCKEHDLQHAAIDALIKAVRSDEVSSNRIAQANRHLDVLFDRFVRPPSRWSEQSASLLGDPAFVAPVPTRAPKDQTA